MMRFILPVILIGVGITVFFVFSNPLYSDVGKLREQVASYNEALDNSKALENERDKLTAKYNSINPENLTKLQKLLPENIDNIRLILEIEKIASPYGMVLKDIRYNATETTESPKSAGAGAAVVQGAVAPKTVSKDYGIWDLGFSTTGTYNNFLNFTRDLEHNLRIVDISSVSFSSDVSSGSSSAASSSYTYSFKIKTYWLKN